MTQRNATDDKMVEIENSRTSSRSAFPPSNSPYKKCHCKCGRCCCKNTDIYRRRRHRSGKRSKICSRRSDYDIIGNELPPAQLKPDDSSSSFMWSDAEPTLVKTTAAATDGQHTRMLIPEQFRSKVVGPQTPSAMERMLVPTQFLLYYRRAELVASVDDVPISEPLTMAYKSSDEQVSHYNVRCTYRNGNWFWRIDLGQGAERQHDFYSLSQLIRHYRAYMKLSGDIF